MSEQMWEANGSGCRLTRSDKVALNEHGDYLPTNNPTTKISKEVLGKYNCCDML